MRNDKHLAQKLRKKGKSYKKISAELGVAKSTLSKWFGHETWSQNIKNELTRKANFIAHKKLRLINAERKKMWEAWREAARQEARKDFKKLAANPLFIAGIMIYWGEGDSKIENCMVRVSNTNSDLLRLTALFFEKICKVPKKQFRLTLFLYPDLNEKKCKNFWSSHLGIPTDQFRKTQYISGRHPTKRLTYGICSITISGRRLKEKIFVWIDLFHRQFPLYAGVV